MIEVSHLNKAYGAKQVLTDVSFTAENGLVTGFVGPNGAGKSTTMRMIAALEKPDSGSATVDGIPFSKSKAPASAAPTCHSSAKSMGCLKQKSPAFSIPWA